MTELLWQATLLLAAAFFFGAVLACSLKRRFYYDRSAKSPGIAASSIPHAPAPGEPKVEVAPRGAPEGERFNRAISGQATPAAAPAATARVAPAAAPIPAPAPTAPAAPAVAAPAPAPAATPVSAISVATGSGAPVKPQEGGAPPSDDLTRIRGVDSAVQKQLKDAGIRRFAELAALTAADIKGLDERLGVPGRVAQENWLGQAQILATGGETYYSRRVDRGMPVPPFTEPAARAPAQAAAAQPEPMQASKLPLAASAGGPGDDLTRVRGIDGGIQAKLRELGIRRFQDLAALTAADVKALNEALGLSGRVEQENWLGQAQILATGGETYYSRRLDSAAPAVASVDAPSAAPAAAVAAADVAQLRSVRSEALLGGEAPRTGRSSHEPDDLKRIRGVGVLIEKKLNSLGIVHYEQVANWTGADIERVSRILDFKGRIERENWIEQARILATGGQTEFSRRSEA